MKTLFTGVCCRCGRKFEYERLGHSPRLYCPRCRLDLKRARNVRWKGGGLAALRQNPELRRLFRRWVAAGMPRPQLGDVLVRFERQILGWYQRAQELREIGFAAEAAEMEGAIEKCQELIERELAKLRGVRWVPSEGVGFRVPRRRPLRSVGAEWHPLRLGAVSH